VQEAVEKLCRQYGKEWPQNASINLARSFGITKQAICNRKTATLAQLAGAGRQEVA
jgi:hypothetical protein